MALTATIHKAELTVSDMDRDYYATHNLTVALHPSETEARMMLRLMAFARHADEALTFTRGLSSTDEPDLWRHHPDGTVEEWIELGQPDEKRLRKACGLARSVTVYCYGRQGPEAWRAGLGDKLQRFSNLTVWRVPQDTERALAALAQRQMRLNALIQDGQLWFGDDSDNVAVVLDAFS
ncbi:YaeQ family protein [Alloalcanivorax gelatiniphagus]|uniref:YaeQ family protein n=1 Tax=Alloalcanivorax gelatiniphagus TaxID=1194167 RepID=A0ABY2XJI2_9GAMM|nr:YaeQ family protein [Alloalcanivorax gelatiniphagus]TMW11439.1 YaeQ family protein [Alloalcanivorax gelatiniphagus]|tara:strand:+ start:278 stop:814 length:537 start_codon:yes stop_codon:yes gene_type:complete